MIRRFITNYVWFWKESFSFMKGHNKAYITLGCIVKAPQHCVFMERWHRMTAIQREDWYGNRDF